MADATEKRAIFSQITGMGDELIQRANDLGQQIQLCDNLVQSTAWTGTSADKFKQTWPDNKKLVEDVKAACDELGTALKNISQQYQVGEDGVMQKVTTAMEKDWLGALKVAAAAASVGAVASLRSAVAGGPNPYTGGAGLLGMPVQAPKASPRTTRLAELEQRRAALEAERNSPLNQLVPDWPLQSDREGMPYRTRADNVRGELDKVNAEIQRLRAGPEAPVGATEAAVGQQPSQAAGAPVERALKEADPRKFSATEGCVLYAQARRDGLLPISRLPNHDGYGAFNYIQYFRDNKPDQIGQVPEGSKDLTQYLARGYAVVWDRYSGLGGAGEENGHIAIVEAVHQDSVEISQAGTGTRTKDEITLDEFISRRLYFIK